MWAKPVTKASIKGQIIGLPIRAVLLLSVGLVGIGAPLGAQDLTSPLGYGTVPQTVGNIGTVPTAGLNGGNGRIGGYRCNQMSWGAACAQFWNFGTFTTINSSAGRNAPSGGMITTVQSDMPSTVDIADYDPTNVNSGGFTVTVTQVAGTENTEYIAANGGLAQATPVNGGYSFTISGVDQANQPFSLSYVETLDPTTQLPVGGKTLDDIAADINALGNGLTASVVADPNNAGEFILSVAGATNDATAFTLTVVNDSTSGGGTAGSAASNLSFAPIATRMDPVNAAYTISGANSGNGSFTSATNDIVVDGVDLSLVSAGTANFTTNQVNAAIGVGANGLAGAAGNAVTASDVFGTISTGAGSVNIAANGGNAGQAGVGGNGGNGGNGGVAAAGTVAVINQVIFPIPSTDFFLARGGAGGGGATGGTGGNGQIGGTGGAIDYTLSADSVTAPAAIVAINNGGRGGQGGQGGQGGSGGNGGDGRGATASRDLQVWVVSAAGNVGGTGGIGGTGGTGGTGGSGGVNRLDFNLGTATVQVGVVGASNGGQGGQGGQGGTGGTGGMGGDAVAYTDYVTGTTWKPGQSGGLGGTGSLGGQGGHGGSGGTVNLTNLSAVVAANDVGILGISNGGQGGQGGSGGLGGTGGQGGDGQGATNYVNRTVTEGGGGGGTGGSGGTAGTGGAGGTGGLVHIDNVANAAGTITATNHAIVGMSYGGTGGTGGTGGLGGTGGNSGSHGIVHTVPSWNVGQVTLAGSGGNSGSGGAGGTGGVGGSGGHVIIANAQSLATTGSSDAAAVLAESLGAIGGQGGASGAIGSVGSGTQGGNWGDCNIMPVVGCTPYMSWSASPNGSTSGATAGATGAAGRIGGSGGTVDLTNSGSISTVGTRSDGILGLSMGGVAGLAGLRTSDVFWQGLPVGSQTGGGGEVSLSNSGNVGTSGDSSMALAALSFGAGQASGTVTLDNTGTVTTTGTNAHVVVGASRVLDVSGQSGVASGDVTVTNRGGTIQATGDGASGLWAESSSTIGDAGAVTAASARGRIGVYGAAAASAIIARSKTTAATVANSGTVAVNVAGGTVIGATSGNQAAVDARSQSSSGNAGGVSVNAANAGFQMAGAGLASAIEAVSETGSLTGGSAGAVDVAAQRVTLTFGANGTQAAIDARSVAATGDAGAVSVNAAGGTIQVAGSGSAAAIEALSAAQGAGSAGNVSVTTAGGTIEARTGGSKSAVDVRSSSASGNAGNVALDNRGGSITSDNSGTAVLLQSFAGGLGRSGNIRALNYSTIRSTAPGSTALTADSTGFASGDIDIQNAGLIEGGQGGRAVALVGGTNNQLINDHALDPNDTAILRTAGGLWDTVITGTTGNDRVYNRNGATMIGSIALGGGQNYVLNGAGSYYETGNLIDIGAGNAFANNGYVSAGGLGLVMNAQNANGNVSVAGDFQQGASGQMLTNLNFTTGSAGGADFADFYAVSGSATLGGFVTLEPFTGGGKDGTYRIPLLQAAGGITNQGITIFPTFTTGTPSNTVTFHPSLAVIGDTLYLQYRLGYSVSILTPNQNSYANNVTAIQNAGVPAYQPVAYELLAISDPAKYQQALDSLTGEGTTAASGLGLAAGAAFGDAVLGNAGDLETCARDKADERKRAACDLRRRGWIMTDRRLGQSLGEDDVSSGKNLGRAKPGDSYTSIYGGIDRLSDDGVTYGLAFASIQGDYSVPARWTGGSMDQQGLALYAATRFDSGAYLKGVLSAGTASYEQSRVAMGRPVNGRFRAQSLGAEVEAGYDTRTGINPFVGFRFDRLTRGGFTEDDPRWGNS